MNEAICTICKLKSPAAKVLSEDELENLENSCSEAVFEAGELIVKQNTIAANVIYLKTGLVKTHLKLNGFEKTIYISKAPAYLSLTEIMLEKTNNFSITAIEKSSVCFINKEQFIEFIKSNGDFAFQVLLDISRGIQKYFYTNSNVSHKNSVGKVASSILNFANVIYENKSFVLPVSRQDLGDILNVARESISNILNDFHKEGIIQLEGKSIRIINEDLLKTIAENG